MNSVTTAQRRIDRVNVPLLIVHGTDDAMVPISASEFIFNNSGSAIKKYEVCILYKKVLYLLTAKNYIAIHKVCMCDASSTYHGEVSMLKI